MTPPTPIPLPPRHEHIISYTLHSTPKTHQDYVFHLPQSPQTPRFRYSHAESPAETAVAVVTDLQRYRMGSKTAVKASLRFFAAAEAGIAARRLAAAAEVVPDLGLPSQVAVLFAEAPFAIGHIGRG